MLSHALISLCSKYKLVFAQSTKEEDYIALSLCVMELAWPKKFAQLFKIFFLIEDVDKMFDIVIEEKRWRA